MADTSDYTIIDEYLPKKPSFAGENYVPTVPGLDPFDRIIQDVEQYAKDAYRFPAGKTMQQAGIAQTAPGVNFNPSVSTPPPQQQPVTKVSNPYLEPYLQRMAEYLQPPVYDKNREKRLQTASLINALGNALTSVVNTMYAGSGTPIIPTSNKYVLGSLAEAQQMRDLFNQREDIYNRTKMGAFFQAGDMAMRDQFYDKQAQWKEQERTDRQNERASDRKWEEDKLNQVQTFQREQQITEQRQWDTRAQKEYDNSLELLKKKHKMDMDELDKRLQDTGKTKAADAATEGGWDVLDKASGKTITIPKEIYWDVLTTRLGEMNRDFADFVSSVDFNSTNNAANAIVTEAWNRYYIPIYDEKGNLAGFQPTKGGKPGSWTGGSAGGASQTSKPAYFIEQD